MKTLGRSLQFFALVLLPVGMVLQLSGGLGRRFGVSDLLVLLVFGIAAFGLGRIIEGYASR